MRPFQNIMEKNRMPEQPYSEITFKTLKPIITSLQQIERALSNAYKEFEKANRLKRVNSSARCIQGIKGIRQYLLAEDKNEKDNKAILKDFIGLLSDLQTCQQGLLTIASQIRDREANANGKENSKGNGKGNGRQKNKRQNKKLDYNGGDKDKTSKIRNFLDNSKTGDANLGIPGVNRKGYVLGFPEKG